jgi:TP901 family phage tail tape measure protein
VAPYQQGARVNELGLGLALTASNGASGVLQQFTRDLLVTVGATGQAGQAIKSYFREFGVGMALFGAGATGLRALEPALNSAKTFGAAIAEVSTETDEATFSTKAMHDIALSLADQFGKMPVEEAKGLYQAVAAGAGDATSATLLMTQANKLAIGGATDTTTAIDGLTSALNAYGMAYTKENLAGVSDAFFVAMRDGKMKVADLAAQVGRVAPSAAALGISFEQVAASVSAMTGQGLKADMAITGLHGALANIIKPSSDAAAEAARLGIKFTQTELRAKGWKGFLDQITHSAKFNANSLSHLFGSVEGLNAIQALTSNGSKKFNEILGDMATRSGATENAFSKMANTLEFSENKYAALKEIGSTLIGEVLAPMAQAVLRFGSAVMSSFNKLPATFRDFLVKAFAVGSVLLVVVGGMIAAKAAVGILGVGLSALGVSFAGVLAAIWPVVAALALVAGAVVAFRYAYEHNLGGFATFIDGVYSKVSLFFRALLQLFESGGFSGAVLDELDAGNEGVEDFAIKVWGAVQRIMHFASELGDGFSKGLDAVAPAFRAFVESLDHLGVALGFITEKGDAASNLSTWEAFGRVGAAAGQALAFSLGVVVHGISLVVEATAFLIDGWKAVVAAGGAVGTAVAAQFAWIKSAATSVYDAIAGAFGKVGEFFSRVGAILGVVGDLIGVVASAIGRKIVGAIAPYIQQVIAYFLPIVEVVSDTFESVKEAISNAISSAFDTVRSVVYSAIGEVVGYLAPVIEAVTSVGNAIYDAWSDAWGRVTGLVDSVVAQIKKAIGSIGRMVGALFTGYGSVKGAAGSIVGNGASNVLTGAERYLGIEGEVASHVAQVRGLAAPYLPSGTPASAAEAAAAGGVPGAPSADAIGGAVAAAVQATPPQVNLETKATMVVDGQVLGEIAMKAQHSAGQSAEVPMSPMR